MRDMADEMGGRRGPRRMRGRPRTFEEARTTAEDRSRIRAWFAGRLPESWFTGPPEITVDDNEILVVGPLAAVELAAGSTEEEQATAAAGRIGGFREDTRDHRIRIAEEAQANFGRQVSWGARAGERTLLFHTASVPVMTRLRMDDRQVLDTLIDAGVARSRSEALAWCVRLVGRNEETWIAQLRSAFKQVEEVRGRGPEGASPEA